MSTAAVPAIGAQLASRYDDDGDADFADISFDIGRGTVAAVGVDQAKPSSKTFCPAVLQP